MDKLYGLHVDAPDTADTVPYMGISRENYPKPDSRVIGYIEECLKRAIDEVFYTYEDLRGRKDGR